jgi:hypothetical protein
MGPPATTLPLRFHFRFIIISQYQALKPSAVKPGFNLHHPTNAVVWGCIPMNALIPNPNIRN